MKISKREFEVLKLIAFEHTAKEIANKLYISIHTVDSHRKSLLDKMNARNTAGMIRIGYERGILHLSKNN